MRKEIEEFKKIKLNIYNYIFDIKKDKFIDFDEYSILLYDKSYNKYRIKKDDIKSYSYEKEEYIYQDRFLINKIYKRYLYNKDKFIFMKKINDLKLKLLYQERIYQEIDEIDYNLFKYYIEKYQDKYKNHNYMNFDDYE